MAQWDPFKPSIWRGQIITIVNPSNILKFFDIKLLILENVIPQMSLSPIYQTWASFFWSTKYTQREINTNGFMQEWTRLHYAQKRWLMCLLLRVTWLVFSEGFEWVKLCKFAVVVSIGQKKKRIKTKERQKAEGGRKFSGVRWLGEESNKIFIEGNSLSLAR